MRAGGPSQTVFDPKFKIAPAFEPKYHWLLAYAATGRYTHVYRISALVLCISYAMSERWS